MTQLNPFFGEFGGMYVPQILVPALLQLEKPLSRHKPIRPFIRNSAPCSPNMPVARRP